MGRRSLLVSLIPLLTFSIIIIIIVVVVVEHYLVTRTKKHVKQLHVQELVAVATTEAITGAVVTSNSNSNININTTIFILIFILLLLAVFSASGSTRSSLSTMERFFHFD
jgi:hypothetical protein